MREKLLALLKPQASPDVKLSVVALFLAKVMDSFEPRIISLEKRQLQKGDKGDKGESVSIDDVLPEVARLHSSLIKDEMADLKVIMDKTWDKW